MAGFGGVGKEAITFLLTGDASDLIKTFGDVEKAADKSLGKTEDKIEKLSATMTKIGAVSMATGLSTALGLVQFIKDAEEAEKATNKFETAVQGMGSSIKTADIKKLAFDLQQVAQVTDEQVVAAARWGAVYGLTTDQLEELLRTAVDLSEQTGKSLDVVTKQLAKAAAGEGYKGLTKLGLTFDETAYKADAFGTTIAEATEFAGGAAAKATDTMSGQLTRLGNNWDNVKEQIGAGANEVFEPLARGAADLLENLAEANPELLKTVGHFTALGSLGMTGFGGLATVAGQIVNIRDAADGLGLKLKNAEGGLTGLGKAGVGLGAVGLAAGIFEVGKALEDATEDARGFATALTDLKLAKNINEQGKAIKDATEASKGWFDKVTSWADDVLGDELTVKIGRSEVAVNQLNQTFDQMADTDPAQALHDLPAAIDAVTAASDAWNKKYKDNPALRQDNPYASTAKHLSELRGELDRSSKSTDKLAEETGGLTKEEVDAAEGAKRVTESLKTLSPAMFLASAHIAQGEAAVKGFSTATEALDMDELVTSAVGLGDAFHTVGETVGNLPHTFDENAAALGLYNEKQTEAITAVTDWGDATKDQIQNLIASGATQEEVNTKSAAYVIQLRDVMKAAGLTDEQVDTYLRTLGLTPEQIHTAVELSGDEEAKWRLGLLATAIGTFEASKQNEINLLIAQGDVQGALAATQAELNRRQLTVPVKAVFNGWSGQNPYGVGYSGGGGWGKAAPGGLSVVPMGATTKAAPAPPPITINVTAGVGDPAEIGRKVIDAIRAAERVQGRGWRAA